MATFLVESRRRLAPLSLGIWPSLANPAWRSSGAMRLFGGRLRVSIDPARIARKLGARRLAGLRGSFMVDGLDGLPTDLVRSLYTYRDMEDIARHGADWRATRLGQWLKAAVEAGRPPLVRGALVTNEAEIEAYYRVYLTMFESMRTIGYRYEGKDDMCFGIGAAGEAILIRRGTHRLAAAQILGLAKVEGRVTHIDRAFAERAVRDFPDRRVPEAILAAIGAAVAPKVPA
jgi:hypothetical protein